MTAIDRRVGSRFVPRLLDHGDDMRMLARDAGHAESLRARGAEVVAGDLRDADALRRAVQGVAAVVHLGASFRGVPDEEAVAVNRDATVALPTAAARAGVARFVLASGRRPSDA